jgi:hypothetical protein
VRGRERREHDREEDGDFDSGVGSEDDDDARSILTIVPHELQRVDEENEE